MRQLVSIALFLAACVVLTHGQSYRRILTPSGPVRGVGVGVRDDLVYQYRNIPYAKPPVGDLRLRKPVPIGEWTNVLDATLFGPSCIQPRQYVSTHLPNQEMSEDCLQLNIYTPRNASPTNMKSVMVWIHGGGYIVGQASYYDASNLTNVGDVIVVTINYRLGINGFLSTMDDASRGNFGLWDQRLAIEWVNNNIASFGGNPSSITIFGESAGSMSVALQALNPQNQGLFQRAICESGPANSGLAMSLDAKRIARGFGIYLNCINANDGNFNTAGLVQCLRGKTAEQLLDAQERLDFEKYTAYRVPLALAPVVDNDFIKVYPGFALSNISSAEANFFRSLDVMMGTTDTEGSLLLDVTLPSLEKQYGFNASRAIPTRILCDVLAPAVAKDFFNGNTDVSQAICKMYSRTNEVDQSRHIVDMYTDAIMTAPTVASLDCHSSPGLTMGRNTFQYLFTRDIGPSPKVPRPSWFRGAGHGMELMFLFKLAENYEYSDLYASENALSIVMMTYWANFAKHGTPNGPGLPYWPRYDGVGRLYQDLDLRISPVYQVTPRRVAFWNQILPNILMSIHGLPSVPGPVIG